MFRLIVAVCVAGVAVALCAGLVLLALCVAYTFTSDPLDVWEDE